MADFASTNVGASLYGYPTLGANSDHAGYAFAISGGSGVAEVVLYLMRGIVSGAPVYWYATIIDTTGAEYTGGGSLSGIRLIKRRQ